MRKRVHKPLEWIKKNVVFPKQAGELAGQSVDKHLLSFQTDFLKEIVSHDGEIKKSAMIYGCRKISKSFLYSALLWYFINDKKRTGFEIPIVASTYEQSKILYSQILSQFKTKDMKKKFKIRKDYFLNKETHSKLHCVYNASSSNLGLQSSGGCFDEIGAFKDDSNLQTITSGFSLSEQRPLILMSSNPPEDANHFVLPLLRACQKDPSYVVRTYSLDANKDWTSESNWCQVNPFLAEWKRSKGKRFQNVMNNYRMLFRRSLESKSNELSFRRLQLGQLLSNSLADFIPAEKIKVAKSEDVFKMKDLRWSCGIDLSQEKDFTAVSFCGWRQQTDELFVKSFLYLPNTSNRTATQKKVFQKWHDAGYIRLQNKEVLDPNEIFSDVEKFLRESKIKLQGIQIDPSLAQHYIEYFEKHFPVAKQKMTGANSTASIRELERIGNSGGLNFIGENPALAWMFQNVIVSKKSKNYVLMNRSSDQVNIDGAISVALALKYLLDNKPKSFLIMSG